MNVEINQQTEETGAPRRSISIAKRASKWNKSKDNLDKW